MIASNPAEKGRRAFASVVTGLAVAAMLATAGCGPKTVTRADPGPAADTRSRVIVAVATPLQETGMADQIAAGFSRQYPEFSVRVVGMDPSAAIAAARAGTVDAVIVPRSAELAAFLKAGFSGGKVRPVMTDSWVLVGPKDDPVGAGSLPSIGAALRAISVAAASLSKPGQTPVTFFAVASSKGTSAVTTAAWKGSGIEPNGRAWYTTVDGGMSDVVKAAAKGNGYAIVDRATFVTLQPSLKVLRASGVAPHDEYVAIQAAGAQSPKAAAAFTEWVAGPAGKGLVNSLGVAADGSPLFGQPSSDAATGQ